MHQVYLNFCNNLILIALQKICKAAWNSDSQSPGEQNKCWWDDNRSKCNTGRVFIAVSCSAMCETWHYLRFYTDLFYLSIYNSVPVALLGCCAMSHESVILQAKVRPGVSYGNWILMAMLCMFRATECDFLEFALCFRYYAPWHCILGCNQIQSRNYEEIALAL